MGSRRSKTEHWNDVQSQLSCREKWVLHNIAANSGFYDAYGKVTKGGMFLAYLWNIANGNCVLCGSPVIFAPLSLMRAESRLMIKKGIITDELDLLDFAATDDHVTPISKIPDDQLDHFSNHAIAHNYCNSIKGDHSLSQARRQSRREISEMRQEAPCILSDWIAWMNPDMFDSPSPRIECSPQKRWFDKNCTPQVA